MTEEEIHAAAMRDPDAGPLTEEESQRDPDGLRRALEAKPG